ncbi:hypothetical protein [Zhaonella formicivorans]|uniref:hypothetical protein n=1 Tax=Zhaonella formicivorans TaxID=2528593 RepID=UPI0030F3D71C
MSISLKFGFIGVGLMGGRVVDTIAQLLGPDGKQLYSTLAININRQDLDSLQHVGNKLQLNSPFKAAGRNPEVGYEALSQNEDTVKKAIADLAFQSDFLWFVAGLGGGTGTGSILQLVQWAEDLQSIGVDFGIIVSLPRVLDGYQENKNALLVLEQLDRAVASRLFPVIIVDNELLCTRYLEKRKYENISVDWTQHSNAEIAGLLHQMNIITTQVPYGHKHFDGEEFRLVLKAGGCMQFAKTMIDIKDFRDELTIKNLLQRSIQNGTASGGYDEEDAVMAGISVFAPFTMANEVYDVSNVRILENAVKDICPRTEVRWGHYVDYNTSAPRVEIYSVISGLGLPRRVLDIQELLKGLKPKEAARKLDLNFGVEIEEKKEKPSVTSAIVNPFARKKVEQHRQGEQPEGKVVPLSPEPKLNWQNAQVKEIPAWLKRYPDEPVI